MNNQKTLYECPKCKSVHYHMIAFNKKEMKECNDCGHGYNVKEIVKGQNVIELVEELQKRYAATSEVVITKFGVIHNYAQCWNCEWDCNCHKNKNYYSAIIAHVKKTGHTVKRESGSSTDYSLSK